MVLQIKPMLYLKIDSVTNITALFYFVSQNKHKDHLDFRSLAEFK
jgi:hypothetical protein